MRYAFELVYKQMVYRTGEQQKQSGKQTYGAAQHNGKPNIGKSERRHFSEMKERGVNLEQLSQKSGGCGGGQYA